MGGVHEVRLPTYVSVSKKTSKALNLNIYRNLHHHHLNKQKQTFHDVVKPLLKDIPRAEKVWIHYTIFAPRNGRLDTMNVGSIVDKYFSDTLVEAKKIADDHFGHVVLVSFSFGGVCPMDGHAIAKIHILEEETPMRIFLEDSEIKEAINKYVSENISVPVQDLIFSSDDNGLSVEIVTGPSVPDAPKPKSKGGRPKGSRNKPKPVETEEVKDEPTEDTPEGSSDSSATAGSESTEADTEVSEENEKPEAKGKKQGNLFGDEESQFSESPDEVLPEEKAPAGRKTVVAKKKPSIFDAD